MTTVARDKQRRPSAAEFLAGVARRLRLPYWRRRQAADAAPVIMKPYMPDPDTRKARGGRRAVLFWMIGFCVFYGMCWAFFTPYLVLLLLAPVAILTALMIWALPDARTAPTGVLVKLFFAYFACLILWPNYLALALPGLPWITMARLTGFPLALALLICVSMSKDFRNQVWASMNATPILWRCLVAFILLQTMSLAVSRSPFYSLDRYAIWQTGFTAVFFASCYIFATPGRVIAMARLLWVMAICVGVIAVVEKRLEHVPWAGHIPSFLQVQGERIQLILAGQRRSGDGIYRAQATFSTSLGLAEYLAYCMPFVTHFAVTAEKSATRWAARLCVPFLLFVVLITGSRLGMIGCLTTFLIYTLIWSVQRWRSHRESLMGPAITLGYPALALLVVGATAFIGRLRTVVWGNGAMTSSNLGRHIQWAMGIPKIKSHPWGYGVGMGGETLGYRDLSGLLTIDSYYLVIVLEYGVVGFLLYYAIFVIGGLYAYRSLSTVGMQAKELSFLTPMTITLANFVVIKSVFAQDDNHPLIAMILGMIAATCWRVQQRKAAAPAMANAAARKRAGWLEAQA